MRGGKVGEEGHQPHNSPSFHGSKMESENQMDIDHRWKIWALKFGHQPPPKMSPHFFGGIVQRRIFYFTKERSTIEWGNFATSATVLEANYLTCTPTTHVNGGGWAGNWESEEAFLSSPICKADCCVHGWTG
jgi:hypothetical protein